VLTDLVANELRLAGAQTVAREQLNLLIQEQSFATTLGADATGNRVKMGSILRADALVLLSSEEARGKRNVRVIVADCRQGARLSSDLISMDTRIDALAHQIAAAVLRTRRRFAGGIRKLVVVSPFISRNFTYEYQALETGYAILLQEALAEADGLAVIEIEEGQAIRRELDASDGPMQAWRVVPLFIDGAFEVAAGADKMPRVRFSIVLRTLGALRSIERRDLTLEEAAKFIARDLPAEVQPDLQAGAAAPFTGPAEFTRLAVRAGGFALRGDWQHSIALRHAALVIDPASAAQRSAIVDESVQLIVSSNRPPALPPRQVVAALMPIWRSALVSLEWEIRHQGSAVLPARVSAALYAGLTLARGSAFAVEAQRIKRDFLLRVFPLIWDLQSDNSPPRADWVGIDQLMRLAVYGPAGPLDSEDFDVLLALLNRVVPKDAEPSKWVTELLWGQNLIAAGHRKSDAFLRFLGDLENSNRPVNRIIARVARLSWQVEHGQSADAAMVEQIAQLRATYEALKLAPIPVAHGGVVQQLNRLRSSATAGAATRPGMAGNIRNKPKAKDANPPAIETGALRIEKLHLQQKQMTGEIIDAGAPGGIIGLDSYLPCGDSLAVAWDAQCISFVHKPGLLEIKWNTPGVRTFADVQWDGTHVWIATFNGGLWIVDSAGNIIEKIGPAQGLQPCDREMHLSVLGVDRIVLAGSFGPVSRAWLAMVDKPGETYRLRVFHRAMRVDGQAGQLPAAIAEDAEITFDPREIGLSTSRSDGHEVVIVRGQCDGERHTLLVDAKTLEVTVAPSDLQSVISIASGGGWALQSVQPGRIALWRAGAHGQFARETIVSFPSAPGDNWQIVTQAAGPDESLCLVGAGWYRVDPQSKRALRLAPGWALSNFVVRGAAGSSSSFVMWGICGNDRCMYRVTVDEEKLKGMQSE
jgi:hypothetical protein